MNFCLIEDDIIQRIWLRKVLSAYGLVYETYNQAFNPCVHIFSVSNHNYKFASKKIAEALVLNQTVIVLSTLPKFSVYKGFEKQIHWIEKPFTERILLNTLNTIYKQFAQ